MKTFHKDSGCTASITDQRDGTAILKVRDPIGRVVKKKSYKTRRSATAAWAAMCRGS